MTFLQMLTVQFANLGIACLHGVKNNNNIVKMIKSKKPTYGQKKNAVMNLVSSSDFIALVPPDRQSVSEVI